MKGGNSKIIGFALWGGMLISATLSLYFFNPALTSFFPPCPFHYVTGYHCPGCGSLRAIHNLLHGHLGDAVSQNPLMVLSIPIMGIMFFNPRWIYKRWVPWTTMGLLIGFGIVRNFPIWPFILLAPH